MPGPHFALAQWALLCIRFLKSVRRGCILQAIWRGVSKMSGICDSYSTCKWKQQQKEYCAASRFHDASARRHWKWLYSWKSPTLAIFFQLAEDDLNWMGLL
ncbi:hypothetical protein GGX14DRAFT_388460 [Mycena pura]|uniref:Secreted protein n=1 Tax=Mycena pura TaxID=153505 RepID=A0AAD6VS75_9AGAR|nr:hypothetical protein GGX14DRAFT_388460 [Mycena pura]